MADAWQEKILQLLDAQGSIADTATTIADDATGVLGVLKRLASRSMVVYETHEQEVWSVTAEGQAIVDEGSHEAKVFDAVPPGPDGIPLADLQRKWADAAVLKVGQGQAFKAKWIKKEGDRLVRLQPTIVDRTREDLREIVASRSHSNADVLKDLRKRKLCDKGKRVWFSVAKGPEFSLTIKQQATDITAEMIQSGSWKTQEFKKYNFDAEGIPPTGGHFHPLMKVRNEFRQIFFEMGFEEMPTNRYVESSFWNFDALFQPQDHPARDMHDTFFIKSPATTNSHPADYMQRVKTVHSVGGYGSTGHGCEWRESDAEKLLLRTHTTAVSSYMLYQLAQRKQFTPAKYFSIDRVFRNETVDATHLAEFHQVEGLIADYNLTLGDLIGFLDVFFKKQGAKTLRFKPTYNPYTEPSLEIFSYHSGLKKWVEIGNSGMFRPEMLLPLGLPAGVRVIAWGLSLERPTMIKYGIDNIRELLGHRVDLDMIKSSPIYRMDKQMGKEKSGVEDAMADMAIAH